MYKNDLPPQTTMTREAFTNLRRRHNDFPSKEACIILLQQLNHASICSAIRYYLTTAYAQTRKRTRNSGRRTGKGENDTHYGIHSYHLLNSTVISSDLMQPNPLTYLHPYKPVQRLRILYFCSCHRLSTWSGCLAIACLEKQRTTRQSFRGHAKPSKSVHFRCLLKTEP